MSKWEGVMCRFKWIYITCESMRMCHVTYENVMSHMNTPPPIGMMKLKYAFVTYECASFHVCMSHVSYERVTSLQYESCHLWMRHVAYAWDWVYTLAWWPCMPDASINENEYMWVHVQSCVVNTCAVMYSCTQWVVSHLHTTHSHFCMTHSHLYMTHSHLHT